MNSFKKIGDVHVTSKAEEASKRMWNVASDMGLSVLDLIGAEVGVLSTALLMVKETDRRNVMNAITKSLEMNVFGVEMHTLSLGKNEPKPKQ